MNENLAQGFLAGITSALLDIPAQQVEKDQKILIEGTHLVIYLHLIALQKDYRALQDQLQIVIQRQVCPVNQT